MDRFSGLREQITRGIRRRLAPQGVTVTEEYPVEKRCAPRGGLLAVGLSEVELPAAPGGRGRVKIALRFDILAPIGRKPDCHTIFGMLCEALEDGIDGIFAGRISCGELVFRKSLAALALTARATFEGVLGPDETDAGTLLSGVVFRNERMDIKEENR